MDGAEYRDVAVVVVGVTALVEEEMCEDTEFTAELDVLTTVVITVVVVSIIAAVA
mgnify:CR=1 FL=1